MDPRLHSGSLKDGIIYDLFKLFFNVVDNFTTLKNFSSDKLNLPIPYEDRSEGVSFSILKDVVFNNTLVFKRDVDLIFRLYQWVVYSTYKKAFGFAVDKSESRYVSATRIILDSRKGLKCHPQFKLFLEDLGGFFSIGLNKNLSATGLKILDNGIGIKDQYGAQFWENYKDTNIERLDYYLSTLHDKVTDLYKGIATSDMDKISSVIKDVRTSKLSVIENIPFVYGVDYEFSLLCSKITHEAIVKIIILFYFNLLILNATEN